MLRLSPFLFYTLSIAAAFSGTAVNHVLAAALSSVPTKSAFHKFQRSPAAFELSINRISVCSQRLCNIFYAAALFAHSLYGLSILVMQALILPFFHSLCSFLYGRLSLPCLSTHYSYAILPAPVVPLHNYC